MRFAIECQDRSWGPSVDARTLTVRRQADGSFRAHWREVLGLGVASRGLPPWKAELRLDLAIDDEDGADLAGTWIEDGKVLDWTGQLHLKV